LRDRQEIERIHRRVGEGFAMVVRRVRPSQRNRRKLISDRQLVDMVCLQDLTLSEVLDACGWVAPGQKAHGVHIKALRDALSSALDRMMGPRSHRAEAMRQDEQAGFATFAQQVDGSGPEFWMAGMNEGKETADQKGD